MRQSYGAQLGPWGDMSISGSMGQAMRIWGWMWSYRACYEAMGRVMGL